jgi:hypothetical protein
LTGETERNYGKKCGIFGLELTLEFRAFQMRRFEKLPAERILNELALEILKDAAQC